ncbi:MAG: hypothetical protein C0424_08945 [Sphingobacteriaceae bacterium]|nr:hypothetical protein [Sphingobacteriaceae bacterium]
MIKATIICRWFLGLLLCTLTGGCLKTYTCHCETVIVENATLRIKSRDEFRIKVEALNRADAEAACGQSQSTIALDEETSVTQCGLR